MQDDVVFRRFDADDAAWSVAQHRKLYDDAEGFDDSFGDLVEQIITDFLNDHDPLQERGWIAELNGVRLGQIFCVKLDDRTAKLRLFLTVPDARGLGLGKALLGACMDFARDKGYAKMQLWTHESHEAACALYRKFGWELTNSKPVHSFGVDLVEQSWEIEL
ncbi:Ribosomal protein S18 acetylase RimI [Shimia gijangensis]|uniref:Ribosomal protein S18 acetylase RimI n=1 Tax=Shimia gijangensis TaxID=1470563 RepID=A0A1M6J378_9RHOB|nr:GNAT family N-acetyltransferase [Shimia gijangensis]SHJ41122.1 Ribosomal protein S18 acetylase RimI [Shimia gijangensis]